MRPFVLAVAQEDCIGAAGNDHRRERGDPRPMLDRKSRGQQVALAQAVGTLDTVAESCHGAALDTGRVAAATIVAAFLGASAASPLLTVPRSGLVRMAEVARRLFARFGDGGRSG
jgi:hypothetical protein